MKVGMETVQYMHSIQDLFLQCQRESFEVSLGILKCEIFTFSPIRVFGQDIQFAPIGLLDMYNSGGAIEALDRNTGDSACAEKVRVRGWDVSEPIPTQNPGSALWTEKSSISTTMLLLATDY